MMDEASFERALAASLSPRPEPPAWPRPARRGPPPSLGSHVLRINLTLCSRSP